MMFCLLISIFVIFQHPESSGHNSCSEADSSLSENQLNHHGGGIKKGGGKSGMADPAEDDSDLTTTSANTNTTSTNGGRVNHVMQVSSGINLV